MVAQLVKGSPVFLDVARWVSHWLCPLTLGSQSAHCDVAQAMADGATDRGSKDPPAEADNTLSAGHCAAAA